MPQKFLDEKGLEYYHGKSKNYIEKKTSNLQSQVDDLVQAVIDVDAINEASGTSIFLIDTAEGMLTDLKVYGRSTQAQYIGKNLIPYPYIETTHIDNGITWIDNKDGTITANGTATGDSTFILSSFTIPKGTYTLNGSINIENTAIQLVANGNYAMTSNWQQLEKTITYDSDTSYDYCRILIKEGTTVNNRTFKPMLRLATITDNTYEPFVNGAFSPSPEYPQNIVGIGNDLTLKINSIGKNLIPYPYKETTHEENGIEWTDLGDGRVMANGTATADSVFILSPFTIPKGTYTLNGSINIENTGVQLESNDNWAMVTGLGQDRTITYSKDVFYNYCRLLIRAGVTVNNEIFEPMLRRTEITDGTYEPYKITTTSIPLTQPLRSSVDGNIKDEIAYVDGLYGIIRRIESVTINESTSKSLGSKPIYLTIGKDVVYKTEYVMPTNNSIKVDALCNQYLAIPQNSYLDYGKAMMWSNSTDKLIFINENMTSLADWNNALQTNPLNIQLVKTNPVFEPFENQEVFDNIVAYDGITYIATSDNAEIWVEYYSNSSIGQRLAITSEEIKEALLNIHNSKTNYINYGVVDNNVSTSISMLKDGMAIMVGNCTNNNSGIFVLKYNSVSKSTLVHPIVNDNSAFTLSTSGSTVTIKCNDKCSLSLIYC